MVFFSCNACGESLKKNQVEKHFQFQCRRCEVLSCVDCSKEFWGDDYKQHIKCLTEEEKYSGKNYQPKANANKGEKKQMAWFEQVQEAIDKVPGADNKLRSMLEKLRDCPNVPRKKNKFENFVKSSLRVFDQKLLNKAWEAISCQLTTPQQQESTECKLKESDEASKTQETTKEEETTNNEEKSLKLSKREKKEERQKQRNKTEKKDKKSVTEEEDVCKSRGKKAKKRKQQDFEESTDIAADTSQESDKRMKKRRKKNKDKLAEESAEEVPEGAEDVDCSRLTDDDQEEIQDTEVFKQKFQWETVIIEVLSAAVDNQLSVKKLKKKVLAEYHARGGEKKQLSEERLWAKFNKKMTKNPRIRVLKDRAKLVH